MKKAGRKTVVVVTKNQIMLLLKVEVPQDSRTTDQLEQYSRAMSVPHKGNLAEKTITRPIENTA